MQTFKTSKARENILSRIRKNLEGHSTPMPYPNADKEAPGAIFGKDDLSDEENFAEAFINAGGKFVFCANELELLENIYTLYENRGWTEVGCAEGELLQLFLNNHINGIKDIADCSEAADACITGCEGIVARTGSILFSSRQNRGRTASIFYPVHLVVVYANQVYTDISQGLEQVKGKYKNGLPSMISVNTGPSRTADIEKTLVTGVHGPGEVFCFFVNADK
jgi:L-lactate dehydrogenase complex protein LldG